MNSRPNIIFIVADDLGYADLGCYGGRDAAFGPVSPNLDRLAGNGLRLTQGYSNSPVCSPTRFALLTARYQYHIRGALEEPITPASAKNSELGLPPEHPTLPSLLKKAGYRTALFGKWHLGYPPRFGPILSGYEEFLGPLGGAIDYFTHCDPAGEHDLWLGAERSWQEGYLTDLLTAKAVEYVERMASQRAPFFMSVHYTAPHWPWETRDDAAVAEDVKSNLFHLHGGSVSIYQRMIHHMDEGIGKLVHTLEKRGLARDTLIIFTSDNGGERFSDNWPLVGGKMDLTEGGIRVPWIAQWPAVIPAGSVSHQPCMTMDWSATVFDLAAAVPEGGYPLDGVSLLHVLRDPAHSFPRDLFWRMNYRSQRAYRQGEWKYLRVDDNDYLFNLANDERERANLGPRMPERLQSMREMWGRWNASIPVIPQDATVTLGFSEKDMPQR